MEMVAACPIQDLLYIKFKDRALVQSYPVLELNIGKVTPTFSVTVKKKTTQLNKAQFINLVETRMSKLQALTYVSGAGEMEILRLDTRINMGEIEDLALQPGETYPTAEVQALLEKYQPPKE